MAKASKWRFGAVKAEDSGHEGEWFAQAEHVDDAAIYWFYRPTEAAAKSDLARLKRMVSTHGEPKRK